MTLKKVPLDIELRLFCIRLPQILPSVIVRFPADARSVHNTTKIFRSGQGSCYAEVLDRVLKVIQRRPILTEFIV